MGRESVGTMHAPTPPIHFRPLCAANLPLLHTWLGRAHVARWWGAAPSLEDVRRDYMELTQAHASTRGYIASAGSAPLGFIQSYVAMGCGGGWWEDETDPGARGIDRFFSAMWGVCRLGWRARRHRG